MPSKEMNRLIDHSVPWDEMLFNHLERVAMDTKFKGENKHTMIGEEVVEKEEEMGREELVKVEYVMQDWKMGSSQM